MKITKLPDIPQYKILLIAGEESGDIYAGRLAQSLLEKNPRIRIEGIGGSRMREAGAKTFHDIADMAVIGILPVLGKLRFFLKILGELRARIFAGEYDAVILVDYAEFNFHLAKSVRQSGVPVFYYITPQVWAWRRYRARTLRDHIDLSFVVFPFEETFYMKRGVNAVFLGHPILDERELSGNRAGLRKELGADADEILLGLLPGSRRGEVARILPVMLEAVKIILDSVKVKPVIALADSVDPDSVKNLCDESGLDTRVVKGKTWDIMQACDYLLCKSGTSTLEAAIAGAPMTVIYKGDLFSYLLVKSLAHTKWAGLPNILAGKEIAPELLQGNATAEKIARVTIPSLLDPAKRDKTREKLLKARKSLGEKGASGRAAKMIINYLKRIGEE